jgi:hypothetical protein
MHQVNFLIYNDFFDAYFQGMIISPAFPRRSRYVMDRTTFLQGRHPIPGGRKNVRFITMIPHGPGDF